MILFLDGKYCSIGNFGVFSNGDSEMWEHNNKPTEEKSDQFLIMLLNDVRWRSRIGWINDHGNKSN